MRFFRKTELVVFSDATLYYCPYGKRGFTLGSLPWALGSRVWPTRQWNVNQASDVWAVHIIREEVGLFQNYLGNSKLVNLNFKANRGTISGLLDKWIFKTLTSVFSLIISNEGHWLSGRRGRSRCFFVLTSKTHSEISLVLALKLTNSRGIKTI